MGTLDDFFLAHGPEKVGFNTFVIDEDGNAVFDVAVGGSVGVRVSTARPRTCAPPSRNLSLAFTAPESANRASSASRETTTGRRAYRSAAPPFAPRRSSGRASTASRAHSAA